MKAQQLNRTDFRRIELAEHELSVLPADGVLVKNEYTAVSVGTEIHNYIHGTEPGGAVRFPRATGYCNAGVVIEVGRDVQELVPGDRVAGQGHHASHTILSGLINKVPANVSLRAAAFMVMCATSLHGHRVARPELGEAVVVTGMGIVGQLAASFAKLSGAVPVIAVDLDAFRLAKARNRGVDVCINPENESDVAEAVRSHCAADGADLVIEATGVPSVYPMALSLPRLGGRLLALGSPRGSVEVSFFEDVHLREVTVLGAHQPKTPDEADLYHPWSKRRDRNLVLRLMGEGKLPIEDLITHEADPSDCQTVYDMLADSPREALGVVFKWN